MPLHRASFAPLWRLEFADESSNTQMLNLKASRAVDLLSEFFFTARESCTGARLLAQCSGVADAASKGRPVSARGQRFNLPLARCLK